MNVFPDLCTRANRCPGIHHGALIDISADVHIRRHHNYSLCKESAVSCQGMGNYTDTQFPEIGFQRNLIMKNRSEEHTSELQSLMRISYAVFCLKKKNNINIKTT